jgi:alpha-amylase/alpha-mannosidase (GH57 family)
MRCVCIHAHFYQPPREDPWLDEVLSDSSATPYHDWNARINAECYRPNRAARLTDENGRIVSIVNNYRYLSFNVGPTLHRWMARHDHVLATRIRTSDEEAAREFGAGNAIAQGYNHMILPLASALDKRTQVHWGAVDFRSRFGRNPVGMWLPETAVDTATLVELAAAGIAFTILAPWQCASVRSPSGESRKTPGGTGLDTSRPYRVVLPSGKSIVVVFYSAEIARDIAFGDSWTMGPPQPKLCCGVFPTMENPASW